MPADDFANIPELPVSFRGYERAATDALLSDLEESYRALLTERDDAKSRVAETETKLTELERELAEHREQSQAVSDALITAEQLKALGERDGQSLKDEAEREAAEIRAQAEHDAETLRAAADNEVSEVRAAAQRQAEAILREADVAKADTEQQAAETLARAEREADGVLREAEARAESLVEEVRRELRERQNEVGGFLDDTRERLGSLLEDLLGRVGRDLMRGEHMTAGTGIVQDPASSASRRAGSAAS